MGSNHEKVRQGERILLFALSDYVCKELKQTYGVDWWQVGVLDPLYDNQKRNLPLSGDWGTLVDSLDMAVTLLLFDLHWGDLFSRKLPVSHRTWVKELKGVRNDLAHLGGKDFTDDDTWRALDTMARLCASIDSESAEEIRAILREHRYGSANGSMESVQPAPAQAVTGANTGGILQSAPSDNLPSWRDVIKPHPDVAAGRYKNAEFAADLAQVARGEGSFEYRDPVEFFARTYVTEGMTGLLVQALRRIGGRDGEPVIQLKTAFGGGKTHSMLALYHMLRGTVPLDKIPAVRPVLARAEFSSLPKANVAVLVGTSIDPTRVQRPPHMPGIMIHTLWGEMAAQLAATAGNPKLYDYVKEADKKGVSPGSEVLKNLFDAAGPCLILMDELVAYAKKIYGVEGLPAGSFDNFISFIQEITEAARASKNSLVVASIPESEIEIGGAAGKAALDSIAHTFGRMEAIWKPVTANEGFEVVRRRLFLDCEDTDGRDRVCAAFSEMYHANHDVFPIEAREGAYRERMVSCYPIHPEVFDRLYEDWATLERFQRTRGVLRLMAAVIHELWMGSDAGLLIMPGSLPMDIPSVRDELTRYLLDGWNALVDSEVDGKKATPYKKDQENTRLGKFLAARRVARTIMLGSAPSVRAQAVRGIESPRISLGVVQPGENISVFKDALSTLETSLAYLYTNPSRNRYWYDTRPTLRKTVTDRAAQFADGDVVREIEARLRKCKKESPFGGLHICPASSLDVPDEQMARLVILRPTDVYVPNREECAAMTAAAEILNNRGSNTPRIYRNMLLFAAPEAGAMEELHKAVRLYLAWMSIRNDRESLNLDAAQTREVEASLSTADDTVKDRLCEAYCRLLVPYVDKTADVKNVQWEIPRIGGNENIVIKAAKKVLADEAVIPRWAPMLLNMELDALLWATSDHLEIKKLWEQLCTYCYLPRLASEDVLVQAIREGVNSDQFFALAAGFDGTRYIDLKLNQQVAYVDKSALLVKKDVAQAQIAADEAKRQAEMDAAASDRDHAAAPYDSNGQRVMTEYRLGSADTPHGNVSDGTSPYGRSMATASAPAPAKKRRFFLSAALDNTRINRDVQNYVEEVIRHLTSEDGAQVTVSLEVHAETDTGFSTQTIRTVSENARTLGAKDVGFEE
ncbi:MAG: DUF499 domain-containing protein [Selenomonas noxia]|uniref:DUF499 domain-containing protein n=1 Tax=Selenomonas noxia TaxID=135083 RepID=UPI001CAF8D77|nr:DUF499 domain-containing protein [Selenomonas noxia]MBF1662768.1 ATP-binding protein [Selenomonas noxia]